MLDTVTLTKNNVVMFAKNSLDSLVFASINFSLKSTDYIFTPLGTLTTASTFNATAL